jgi:hypothetical protein
MSVAGSISENELLRRAVTNARSHFHRGRTRRWACVMELFALQSDDAKALCRYFKVDPEEMVIP